MNIELLHTEALTVTGQHHLHQGKPCQDAWAHARDERVLVVAVSDGVGSVPLAHHGAELHVKEGVNVAFRAVHHHLDAIGHEAPLLDAKLLGRIYSELHTRLRELSGEVGLAPPRAIEQFLAATLQMVIVTESETIVLALGDGFLRMQGQLHQIEDLVGRPEPTDARLPPPLLATAIWHDSQCPSAGARGTKYERFLRKEAEAFYILAHGRTEEVFRQPVELATDGLRFTDATIEPSPSMVGFPVYEMIRKHNAKGAKEAVHCFNLAARFPDREPTDVQRITAIREVLLQLPEDEQLYLDLFGVFQREILSLLSGRFSKMPRLQAAIELADAAQLAEFLLYPVEDCHAEVVAARAPVARAVELRAREILSDRFGLEVTAAHRPLWDDCCTVLIAPREIKSHAVIEAIS